MVGCGQWPSLSCTGPDDESKPQFVWRTAPHCIPGDQDILSLVKSASAFGFECIERQLNFCSGTVHDTDRPISHSISK